MNLASTKSLFCSTALALSALHNSAFAQSDGFTQVPDEVTDLVALLLPEYSNAGTAYVSEAYSPNLIISEAATVELVFIWEGAGYQNSLGWFTYEIDGQGIVSVTDANLVWSNVSFPGAGIMRTGDTQILLAADGQARVFQPGERIGFFVVADGNRRSNEVANWDPFNPSLPKLTPGENALVSGGKGCYTSLEVLNPEYSAGDSSSARHLAMIKAPGVTGFMGGEDYIISGFEDLNRNQGSDDDFNDLVFIVDANPLEAIEDTDIFVYAEGDPDGDGVEGVDDHFPFDSERAFILREPTHGYTVIGFEDLYPNVGDADYNDVGMAYAFEVVTDSSGNVKDLLGDFHLVTRGAGLDHMVGLHFPDINVNATGTIEIERFLSNNAETHQMVARTVEDMIETKKSRIPDLFPSTQRALPGKNSAFTNTTAPIVERESASARLHMCFDTAIPAAELGPAPYDLWFGIRSDAGLIDVHLPGYPGFEDRPANLPVESGTDSFLDQDGYPWIIEIPTNWKVPLERVRIDAAYPEFQDWTTSSGSRNGSWYLNPADQALHALPLADYIPIRDWAVALPQP